MTPRAEALLYAADRAHHVETVIRPALAAGQVVLTDRYIDSTLAYQGAGRGLRVDQARVITDWATDGLRPHLTVLLDLDPVVGLQRAGARAALDRLEGASLEFHRAVRAGLPARWPRADPAALPRARRRGAPADELAAQIRAALAALPRAEPLGVKRCDSMAVWPARATRWTRSSPPGSASAPTSTSRRCR